MLPDVLTVVNAAVPGVTLPIAVACNPFVVSVVNVAVAGVMLPIYYGTSFLTFCQISGLKEAFEKIIKYQTALKFEF